MSQIERIINVADLLLFQWKSLRIDSPFFDIDVAEFAVIAGSHDSLVRILEGLERQGCISSIGSHKDTSEWRYIIRSQGDIVSLKVIQDKLKHYREVLQKNVVNNSISLSNFDISYDEYRKMLVIGSEEILIEKSTNQDYVCKVMFKEKVGAPIHWAKIYEIIQGADPKDDKKDKKTIEDTVYMINNKVKTTIKTNDLLFRSSGGHIIRQY